MSAERIAELEGELAAAEADNKKLRAGEAEDEGPRDSWPTPEQWIKRFNDATAERRLDIARRVLAQSAEAARCFETDHEGRLDHLAKADTELRVYRNAWQRVGDLSDADAVTQELLDRIDVWIREQL